MGPEATQKFINPEEVIKRLAAAQGIDTLNLVRSMDELKQEEQDMMQQQQQAEQQKAAMSSPMADPTKNPQLMEQLS
jgi:FtsZ-binding cell division protein ZapB